VAADAAAVETFLLRGAADASLRGTLTRAGPRVYATLHSPHLFSGDTVFIDPVSAHTPGAARSEHDARHVVYRKSQYAHTHAPCGNAEHGASATSATDTARAAATPPGQTTYGAE